MLYLGIDQHARQITISLRDDNGDVRWVTQWRDLVTMCLICTHAT
jgi:hypothetical protein